MNPRPIERISPCAIPRPVVDALIAYVHPVRALEVTEDDGQALSACEKSDIAYAAIPDLAGCARAVTPDEEQPDLVLLTATWLTNTWSPVSAIQEPIAQAWLTVAPGGIVAVWLPAGPRLDRRLTAVLGALPSRRLEAVWAFAERPEHIHDLEILLQRRRAPCAYLVLFRAQPEIDVEYVA